MWGKIFIFSINRFLFLEKVEAHRKIEQKVWSYYIYTSLLPSTPHAHALMHADTHTPMCKGMHSFHYS